MHFAIILLRYFSRSANDMIIIIKNIVIQQKNCKFQENTKFRSLQD